MLFFLAIAAKKGFVVDETMAHLRYLLRTEAVSQISDTATIRYRRTT